MIKSTMYTCVGFGCASVVCSNWTVDDMLRVGSVNLFLTKSQTQQSKTKGIPGYF